MDKRILQHHRGRAEMKKPKAQITECTKCGYKALTWGSDKCLQCEGKLEVLASELKKEEIK
ncbi:hypothetical protein LCGC14_0953830 [marine sediment metagenome]|uniref:Uncharacterized protein n=1 Tax=marine sediment metagenome TaxID=412755 RepID=A0A0F9RMW0_9ZZZZ